MRVFAVAGLGLLAVLLLANGVLPIEHTRTYGYGREDVDTVDPQVALGVDVAGTAVVQGQMTPAAMQPRDAVVALDLFAAFGTLSGRVALDPVVEHPLCRPRRFDVGGDAGGRSSLDTSLVNSIFAYYKARERIIW